MSRTELVLFTVGLQTPTLSQSLSTSLGIETETMSRGGEWPPGFSSCFQLSWNDLNEILTLTRLQLHQNQKEENKLNQRCLLFVLDFYCV